MGLLQLDLELYPELSLCTDQMLTGWWQDDHFLSPGPQEPFLGFSSALSQIPALAETESRSSVVWKGPSPNLSLSHVCVFLLVSLSSKNPCYVLSLVFPILLSTFFPWVTLTNHLLCARPLASHREQSWVTQGPWQRSPHPRTDK